MRLLLAGLLLSLAGMAQAAAISAGPPEPLRVSSGVVTTELTVANGATLKVNGDSGKIQFNGAAAINLSNSVGDSVLAIGGTGTGLHITAASSEIRFGATDQVVLKRTGNDEMTVFTDNGTGGAYLLMAPLSRTKAQLDAITPPIAGQLYYCSDCTTDGVVVSTGTTIAAFGRISARSTKPQ